MYSNYSNYDRLRPYTEFVTVDLDIHTIEKNDTFTNVNIFKVKCKCRVIESVFVVDKKRNSHMFDEISFKQSKINHINIFCVMVEIIEK
jgi:hypothetical protein